MRTVLISSESTVPVGLRDLIERGSTSIVEHRADELAGELRDVSALDADRIVLWAASPDVNIHRLAEGFARQEAATRRERVVLVTAEASGPPPPSKLSPHEVFVWPRDEDRLKMAFLTGA